MYGSLQYLGMLRVVFIISRQEIITVTYIMTLIKHEKNYTFGNMYLQLCLYFYNIAYGYTGIQRFPISGNQLKLTENAQPY